MKTFTEVMSYFEQQVTDFEKPQSLYLSQLIVNDFLVKLPKDWEKTELEEEQPHLLKIAELLKQKNWDFIAINSELLALDDIMYEMDEDYPADMDLLPITLLNMRDLVTVFEEEQEMQFLYPQTASLLIEQYLNVADYFADIEGCEKNPNFSLDDTDWLNYPLIKQAFNQLNDWISVVKNSEI